jgi:hypothetical protein
VFPREFPQRAGSWRGQEHPRTARPESSLPGAAAWLGRPRQFKRSPSAVGVEILSQTAHDLLVTSAEAQALADIRGFSLAGRWVLSAHARRRAAERGVRLADVRCALVSALKCSDQGDGTWKVPSKDTAGDALTAIVALEDGVLVVTLF